MIADRRLFSSGLLIVLLAAAPVVSAVEMNALYTAEVPLDSTLDNPRAAAYEDALATVLLRVSGSRLAADPELTGTLFPDPSAYVVQFSAGADDTLLVSFDGDAVERTLRQAGQRVWGRDRPLTLVWLAVDWGQGQRDIIGANDPEQDITAPAYAERHRLLRQRLLDVAERRGLPLLFPLLDSEDLATISFSDLWGGFDDRIEDASTRYAADAVLVGRVRPASGQRNRWSYYFGGEERVWTGEPELVLSLIADELAQEFSISGASAPVSVPLAVSGITSVEAYGRIQRTLDGLSVVDRFTIVAVEGDRIRYDVYAYGGAARLSRALELEGLLQSGAFAGDGFGGFDAPLEFYLER